MKKLILFVGLVPLFLASFFIRIDAKENAQISVYSDNFLEKNYDRVELATKVEKMIMDYYNIEDIFEDLYPSYFGGMYISDDAENLIIQVVEKHIPNKETEEYDFYNTLIKMDDSIKIEFVENSFNELNEINNNISNIINKSRNYKSQLNGLYIDVMNNSITVEVEEDSNLTKEKIIGEVYASQDKDKKETKKNILKLSFTTKAETFENMKPGQKAKMGSNLCSMGFRTKLNGKVGFMTAGHCVSGISNLDIKYGTKRMVQFANNEKNDYAFIETSSGYIPLNDIADPKTNYTYLAVLTNSCPVITVNMAIAKDGYTTKYTTGKITGLNQTINYTSGITIKGLVKSTCKADHGDSGGIVFIPRKDSSGGSLPIGIISGGNSTSMSFTHIDNLPIELQSNRY